MPITHLKARTYKQAKKLLIESIEKNSCVFLYGSGKNGKSYLIDDIRPLINRLKYRVHQDSLYNKMILRKSILCVNSLECIASEYNDYVLIDMNSIKFK